MSKIDDKYDAIIIGAGIGGLVCGCYLAKAGMKVLIVEKNAKPGGYCTSFNLNGFTFDLGIHALEACGKEGIVRKVLQELELTKQINILRINPSDIILTKDVRINIWNDIIETRNELKKEFLKEAKHIDKFFDLLINNTPIQYFIKFKNTNLKQVLNNYFRDKNLLNIFSILIRNIGTPLEKLSAVNGMIFLKQYLKDGGYYPKGGMLKFSDILATRYKELNGKILFSTEVADIIIKNGCTKGVIPKEGNKISSNIVISNCDATKTLSKYTKKVRSLRKYQNRVKKMKISLPAIAIFLALNKKVVLKDKKSCAIWYSKSKNVNKDLLEIFEGKKLYDSNLVMITVPCMCDESLAPTNGQGVSILTTASFRKNSYWLKAKSEILRNLLVTSSYILGNLKKKEIKHIAIWTPHMFGKMTNNREGAIHGWAPLIDQVDRSLIPEKLPILGLYMVGHWTTQPGQGGLPMVFNSAKSVSNMILRNTYR